LLLCGVLGVVDQKLAGTHAQEYISNLADMASAPYLASMWDTGGSQLLSGLPGSCRVFITHSMALTTISHGTGAVAVAPMAQYGSTFPLTHTFSQLFRYTMVLWLLEIAT